MTYAEAVTLLEETALLPEVGAASFWHGAKAAAGINYNRPFPQVHLFLMPDMLTEQAVRYSIGLGFFDLDQHENGTADTIALQDKMDRLSQRFLRALREAAEDDVFEVGKEVSRVPTVRRGPSVGTGYYVDFTLTATPLPC